VVLDGSLAVNRRFRDKQGRLVEEVTFIPFVAWNKAAETIVKFGVKGSTVLLDGQMRQDRWEDKETGKNRSRLYLYVESFQFMGKPASGERTARRESAPANAATAQAGANVDDDDYPQF
ncbi:MAG: single-stranded DNA-binding protein, partial [Verrucomicrobiota bacterium]